MYWINKIVTWLTSPLGMMFLGVGAGLALARWGKGWRRPAGRWLVGAALAMVWLMGCGVVTRLIGPPLEADGCVPGAAHGDVRDLPRADAIVVLGGGMGAHPECGAPEMLSAADRAWTGAKLWKLGKAPLIALSGGNVEKSTVPFMVDMGVDKAAMRFFPDARNTEEEARHIAALGVKRILLVTSAWHMPRAKMLFVRAGFEVIPAPADFEMSYAAEQEWTPADFFPSADALMSNSYCVKEWVARFLYWLKGLAG